VRLLVAFAFAVAALASATPSRADVEAAKPLFAEGVVRFQKGDFEAARRYFEDANKAHHSPVIDYNLALTEERLGHLQAAVEGYEHYLTEAGDSGEFAQPAAVAVAQIKARAGRISVQTDPPGCRVFINGIPMRERTPTTVLVPPGEHLVVAEGDIGRDRQPVPGGYRMNAVVSLTAGQIQEVTLNQGDTAPKVSVGSAAKTDLEGLVWGGQFQVVPYGFFARNQPNAEGATGIFVGAALDAGFAFTSRAVIGLRAYGSVGSECKKVFDSHIASVGPMLAVRVYDSLWLGAGLYGGNGETCRLKTENGKNVTEEFSTDIVFSPVFDISYAVTSRHYGQWLVSLGVGYFFATPSNDNRLIYAPAGFGPRFF
jgi:hypothetical protein